MLIRRDRNYRDRRKKKKKKHYDPHSFYPEKDLLPEEQPTREECAVAYFINLGIKDSNEVKSLL